MGIQKETVSLFPLSSMPNAQCPMPNAQCPMPNSTIICFLL
ncbi:MAG: histidine kinase [Nostoc sp.]